MRLTRLLPPGAPFDTAEPDARARLRQLYALPRTDWLRLNLIAGVDGGARGSDGTSATLSNTADRAILGAIRSLADVVLIGADTLRAEGYLLPRSARLAVLTGTGELAPTGSRSGPHPRPVLVIGPAAAEQRARLTLTDAPIEFVALPGARSVDPTHVIAALRERGARSIVCEGGPSLAAQLLDADLVDELCVSTSPRLTGGELPMLGGAGRRDLELHGLLADERGGVYARWSVRTATTEAP